MNRVTSQSITPPRIEYLKIGNFRALKNVEFKNLTPMTVLLGPAGSGKSTVFDVFAFLAECFDGGLRRAWGRRGRSRELKTRGAEGSVTIEIKYREQPGNPLVTYRLEVDEFEGAPVVMYESLHWRRGSRGKPFHFLEYQRGQGNAVTGEVPDTKDGRVENPLKSPDLIAVNALGQFQQHPRVAVLRDFIMGWHLSCLSAESARGQPETGPHERLTRTGDNLANVIQYLAEQHPERLERIFSTLRRHVPHIDRVLANTMQDGRLLLQIRDAPFSHPVMARFASDGTLKMLAYLVLLHDPDPSPFIGIDGPENFFHPRLLYELAEECREASERAQLLVTTYSPFFLDALRPKEVRILWRDEEGYTQTRCTDEITGVPEFVEAGAQLGELWMEGQFGMGDPLTDRGAPAADSDGDEG